MSLVADILAGLPAFSFVGRVVAVSAESLLLRLADPCEDGPVQRVRATGVGAALLWLEELREGRPEVDALLEDLMTLTDRACKLVVGA